MLKKLLRHILSQSNDFRLGLDFALDSELGSGLEEVFVFDSKSE